jgi:hypothetical protein
MKRFIFLFGVTILLIVAVLVYVFARGIQIARYTSPTGEYYVTVSELPSSPFAIGMPGDGDGWSQYVCRLYNASGKHIASSIPEAWPEEVGRTEEPLWLEDYVIVIHEQNLWYKKKEKRVTH